MEDKRIDFKTALLLKELKFNITCDYFLRLDSNKIISFCTQDYESSFGELLVKNNQDVSDFIYSSRQRLIHFTDDKDPFFLNHPTQSLIQKWLREVYNMSIEISSNRRSPFVLVVAKFNYSIFHTNGSMCEKNYKHDTYEKALETAIVECLRYVINYETVIN